MGYQNIYGRIVYPVTTDVGQKDYYEHLNYWHVCFQNTNKLAIPTRDDTLEYLQLKAEEGKLCFCQDKESKSKYRKLELYETQYDWRPEKTGDNKFVGLISPTGEQLLPNCFADVFTQFDAINNKPDFIPVSNGEAWALVSLSIRPIMMTDFQYNAIVPERWGRSLFFVQDKATMKWGAMSVLSPCIKINDKHTFGLIKLETVMPPIADEIYEDELITEESPTIFFMTRNGDRIGILTDFGYSDIIYDSYETDNAKCSFRLIRHYRKRARRADYWHPDGKDLYLNRCRKHIGR